MTKRIKLKLGGMSPVEYRKISNKSINNLSNFRVHFTLGE